VLTCTGELSRNRRFGEAVAKGSGVEDAIVHIGQVVEGVRTAAAVASLATRLEIELPLMQTVHHVLSGALSLECAVWTLMSRPEGVE